MTRQETTTTVAILGANPVVENALALLLGGAGYSTKVLEEPSAANAEEQLVGVDVVLLTPSLSEEDQEGFLKALEATPPAAAASEDAPVVLTLSSALKEAQNGRAGMVPWPAPLEDLRQAIESALAPVLKPAEEGGG